MILGIDPGIHGAIAMLKGSVLFLFDLPVITDGKLKWIDGAELQAMLINCAGGHEAHAVIEKVHAMPEQGVSSSFSFGVGFGSILSILQARYIPIEFVTPATWKRALGLSADKKASLHKARLLYPNADLRLEKHEGRAEALLIAHWATRRDHSV